MAAQNSHPGEVVSGLDSAIKTQANGDCLGPSAMQPVAAARLDRAAHEIDAQRLVVTAKPQPRPPPHSTSRNTVLESWQSAPRVGEVAAKDDRVGCGAASGFDDLRRHTSGTEYPQVQIAGVEQSHGSRQAWSTTSACTSSGPVAV